MTRSTRTNVIFILTDDQGPWAMGAAGNREIRTPNIDRLAATGLRFTDFFCTSPVCSPARASLFTGRMPSQHGVHDWIRQGDLPPQPVTQPHSAVSTQGIEYLSGLTCYSQYLADAGYRCGFAGKWHLGDSLRPQGGFGHWFITAGGDYNNPMVIRDGRAFNHPGYTSTIITDDALSFLDSAAGGDSPFYLSVHYTAPHSPWTGHPQHIVDSYDNCPFASCPQEPRHPWAANQLTDNCLGNREMLKGYFAAVTAMDEQLGRIIDRVESLGLQENTLIAFMSDNGFSCGHHGFWGKGNGTYPMNMYDNSVKVPAIFSQPGRIGAGTTTDTMASGYDWMPTLLDYLGLPAMNDATLPGRSFASALLGRPRTGREEVVVFDEYGPVRMIRSREWKYVHRHGIGPDELYDLVNDPDERRNLADDPGQAGRLRQWRGRLDEWFARYSSADRDGARQPVRGQGQLRMVRGPSEREAFYW